MHFKSNQPIDTLLNILFERYEAQVPAVGKIMNGLIAHGVIARAEDIVNDHIAFRTLGVPHLGIASLEKIFMHYGYRKMDAYHFTAKKLDAFWYAPPAENYPRVFISELRVAELSETARQIIARYTLPIQADPVAKLHIDDGAEVGDFFHQPLWALPTKADYLALRDESEYAAWVIYNRYYLNHYTISVHALKDGFNTLSVFNTFAGALGIRLNTEGGAIKTSTDGLLRQSATVAEMKAATFACGETMPIPGSYIEFAERLVLPQYAHLPPDEIKTKHRREGFETGNADKIFESTYIKQTGLMN